MTDTMVSPLLQLKLCQNTFDTSSQYQDRDPQVCSGGFFFSQVFWGPSVWGAHTSAQLQPDLQQVSCTVCCRTGLAQERSWTAEAPWVPQVCSGALLLRTFWGPSVWGLCTLHAWAQVQTDLQIQRLSCSACCIVKCKNVTFNY